MALRYQDGTIEEMPKGLAVPDTWRDALKAAAERWPGVLIEPKPQEPTKHQYDYDVATVYATIASLGLQQDVKVNIEQNHAILAGHSTGSGRSRSDIRGDGQGR